MLLGNHDGGRCATAMEADPQLHGALDPKRWFYIERNGWQRHEFLHQLVIEGITFSHYFANPNAKGAIGGTPQNKLNKLKMSFVMGHQQGVGYAQEPLKNGKTLHGLVLGSCYEHDEEYRGPQDQNHFQGCAMLHDVHDGEYDLELVSLERIKRMYS
jgi:hypothetical protein